MTTVDQVSWAATQLLAPEADALHGATLTLDGGSRRGLLQPFPAGPVGVGLFEPWRLRPEAPFKMPVLDPDSLHEGVGDDRAD